MESHGLKEFVQRIQNKVSIGVAIAVIRSKSSHLTAREYAEEIQERFFEGWMKCKGITVFGDKILQLQQDKIYDQITDLLQPAPSPEASPKIGVYEDFSIAEPIDFCEKLAWPGVKHLSLSTTESSDSEDEISKTVENNISFVQSMVQLKFAVESKNSLPLDKVYSCLYDQSWKRSDKQTGDIALRNPLVYSEDSGFGDSVPLLSKESSCVPSRVLRFLTHSFKTEVLIHKCMSSLLHFTENALLNEPVESFKLWKGSVLEHLVTVFKEVSGNLVCSESLTTFVLNILEKIWTSDKINQFTIWEFQLKILSEFCHNKFTIEAVISFIMTKISFVSSKLSEGNIYSPESVHNIHYIEKLPLFLSLLSATLKKWQNMKGTTAIVPMVEITDKNITELWKKKWSEAEERTSKTDSTGSMEVVHEWKSSCEKLLTNSTEQFPLITFEIWEILQVLNSSFADT